MSGWIYLNFRLWAIELQAAWNIRIYKPSFISHTLGTGVFALLSSQSVSQRAAEKFRPSFLPPFPSRSISQTSYMRWWRAEEADGHWSISVYLQWVGIYTQQCKFVYKRSHESSLHAQVSSNLFGRCIHLGVFTLNFCKVDMEDYSVVCNVNRYFYAELRV